MKLKLEKAINGFIVTLAYQGHWETQAVFEELNDAIELFTCFSLGSLEKVTMIEFQTRAKIIKAQRDYKRIGK